MLPNAVIGASIPSSRGLSGRAERIGTWKFILSWGWDQKSEEGLWVSPPSFWVTSPSFCSSGLLFPSLCRPCFFLPENLCTCYFFIWKAFPLLFIFPKSYLYFKFLSKCFFISKEFAWPPNLNQASYSIFYWNFKFFTLFFSTAYIYTFDSCLPSYFCVFYWHESLTKAGDMYASM